MYCSSRLTDILGFISYSIWQTDNRSKCLLFYGKTRIILEEFEDTKGVIRNRQSKKCFVKLSM
jgi:hypothetical protein